MKFSNIRGPLSDAAFQQLQANIRSAIEKFDFDSGWVAVPADKTIVHALGKQPLRVVAYASDDQDGEPFVPEAWTSANTQNVVVAGTKKYCRVLVDL